MAIMPMFPLGSTMVPGSLLRLHVFEPRYRALMEHVLAQPEPELGVVLIARGSEVGGGDQRLEVASVAQVLESARSDDGRFGVLAGMGRRIRVREWLTDDPYPQADVEDWRDDPSDTVAADELEDLTRRTRRAMMIAEEVGEPSREQGVRLSDDPTVLSYQLASMAPIGDLDRYELLRAPGAGTRARRLGEMLTELEPVFRFRLTGGNDLH